MQRNREMPLLAGGMPVFSRKWGMKPDGSRIPFDQLAFEKPIGSGPYLIEQYDNGRTITYRRDPDYWGATLPVRVGMYNFERIVYKLYSDDVARLEAFKAGEYDAMVEYVARNWVRRDVGKTLRQRRADQARISATQRHAACRASCMNLRRPMFQDVRVRKALDLAFDFQWLNRQLFFNQYTRTDSFFANTDLQANGHAARGRARVARAVARATRSGGVRPTAEAARHRSARFVARQSAARRAQLLAAGRLDVSRRRVAQREGRAVRVRDSRRYGSAAHRWSRLSPRIMRNLQKLGITANFRTVDFAVYPEASGRVRLRHDHHPHARRAGAGHRAGVDRFGSKSADTQGSDNMIGLKSPAVDAIVHALVSVRRRASNWSTPRTRSTGC